MPGEERPRRIEHDRGPGDGRVAPQPADELEAALAAMTAADLKRVPFKDTADRIITLGELLDLVAGRVTLAIELKSLRDGDGRLPWRAAQLLAGYRGPAALMSFDPFTVFPTILSKSRLHRNQQSVVVEGFNHEVDGPVLHSAYSRVQVSLRADEYDRWAFSVSKPGLHL